MRIAMPLFAALLLALPALAAPVPDVPPADAVAPPRVSTAVPMASNWTWNGDVGFDWAARTNHTHVVIDAAQPVNSIDLGTIRTPFLDLEILHLEGGQPLEIVDTILGETYTNQAYPLGYLVLWDVHAYPGSLTLRDARDGSLVTTIVLDAESATVTTSGRASTDADTDQFLRYPQPPCGSCAGGPRPEMYQDDVTWVFLNGAISNTAEATLSVTTGWKHANQFQAAADFGAAAGSLKYSRSFAWTEETQVGIQSRGIGQGGESMVHIRKEKWSDGSTVIYMTGPARGYGSVGWYWTPPHCCHPYIIENGKTNGAQTLRLSEAHSGAVAWGNAWKYEGFTGSATTTSTDDNAATVTFSIQPPDDDRHVYTWNVVTGDAYAHGMVGWIYKDS